MDNKIGSDKAFGLRISGRVQGVFFRAALAEQAHLLGVVGWARNLGDGSVEALVQGPEYCLDALIKWCRQGGPPRATVDSVVVTEQKISKLDRFEILH